MPENSIPKLFRSSEELGTAEVAQINGKIPNWVKGTFMRTGPAKFDLDCNFTMGHWIDGFAMLSKFYIQDDLVTLEKKYLKSDAYKRGIAAKKTVITEFGTKAYQDPNKSLFSRLVSAVMPIELSDNGQVAIFQLGCDLFATSETCFFRQIDSSSLNTGDKFDTNKYFGVNIACAHPLTDETGATYNIGSSVITGLKYNVIRIPPPSSSKESGKELMKKAKVICTISSSWMGLMSYNHSFFMTKNYIILIEQPYVMNVAKAAKTYLKGPCFKEWVEWRPELSNKFFVVNKHTGKVMQTSFIAKESFFFFHSVNAYEENDQLILDLISYPDASVFDAMDLSNLRYGDKSQIPSAHGTYHRYVIPLVELKNAPEGVDLVAVKSDASAIRVGNSIILTPEALSEPGLELPAINKSHISKKHGFIYAAGVGHCKQHNFSNAICKVDIRSRKTLLWRESEFYYPGEPIFLKSPTTLSEDDGVLISAVCDSRDNENDFLLFLDAKTLKELGRAKFKSTIPSALHGIFLES